MIHEVNSLQNEQTFHVSPGDIIRVELEENPTTGYSWQVPETTSFLSVLKNEYHLQQRRGVGSGGVRTIELKVEQSGTHSLELKHWQRWSGVEHQTFQLKIESA